MGWKKRRKQRSRSRIEGHCLSLYIVFSFHLYLRFFDVIKQSEVWACPGIGGESHEPAQMHVQARQPTTKMFLHLYLCIWTNGRGTGACNCSIDS